MELSELIQQAQSDMERGDYKPAARRCEHAIAHAPACFTAHRLLGECHLELHDVDAAIAHFQTALNYDPMSVVVRLGMGVAAEERKDVEAAYACYLHAWEINPGLDQVRDHLVSLRRALGIDPRLHLTPSGLASVHLRAGRYDRAISGLRRLVEAEPQARRARSALVEAFWRNGDDAAASVLCRGGLDQAPENARYLAILAEIELRLKSATAARTVARLHAIDPLGEIAGLMAEWRPDRDVSALFAGSTQIPDFVPVEPASPFRSTKLLKPVVAPIVPVPVAAPVEEPVLAAVARGVAGLDSSIQPFVWDEAPAAYGVADAGSSGWDDWRDPSPIKQSAAVDVVASLPANRSSIAAKVPSAFETSDGQLDLTAGWDDLDQELANATPTLGGDDRFADLMAELSVDGIAPFDAVEGPVDESAWEPLFAAEVVPSDPAVIVEPPVDIQPVVAPVIEAAEPVEAAPADADEFGFLEPFSFEAPAAKNESSFESGFDFSDLDVAATPPPARPPVSTLVRDQGAALAAALAETFPDESSDIESAVASTRRSEPVPAQQSSGSVSIFHVLRASKSRSQARPSMPAPAPSPSVMFHVEHPPAAPDDRPFAIGRDELMTLRIRLIEEEHSADEVARALESKLGDGRSDPFAARVLGEAYLRLGKSDQAAAQFRQAMLARNPRRDARVESEAR